MTPDVYAPDLFSANQLVFLRHLLIWLMPLGVALVAVGVSEASRAHQVATSLPLALVIALGGYTLCGYAFQFGGVGLISTNPGLERLHAEWSPLDLRLGSGWGVIGLRGFVFSPHVVSQEELALFISQLALVTTATLIPLTALRGHIPWLPALLLALLVACVGYPLTGNWLRGGGWLSQIGATLGLAHGFVDYGLSSLHLVGGCAALAGLVAFRRRGRRTPEQAPELPPTYLPLNVLVGAFLTFAGWFVMLLSQPLVSQPQKASILFLNALWAISGAILSTLFYGWLVRGEADPGLTGRGILAALVATSAGLPFVSSWVALLIGAFCGLLLAPTMYLVEYLLKLDDRGAIISIHGFPALWGLLAVGLFADGKHGMGWNVPGFGRAADALARGVTGYFMGSDPAGDTGQLYAQLIGMGAIVVLAALIPWTLLTLAAQAYAVPMTVRERARERAAALQQKRELGERLKLQGYRLNVRQRVCRAYLRQVAAPNLRLLRRARVSRQRHMLRRTAPPRCRRLQGTR